jgi:hypothetical protein
VSAGCGQVAVTAGEEPPAMSISYVKPTVSWDSGYVVIFSDVDPDDEREPSPRVVCLHCLIQDGDEQLGRGLDLAKQHGQVDYDAGAEEWFVPKTSAPTVRGR